MPFFVRFIAMEAYNNIPELVIKYNLIDFGFDTEYIYDKGDLSNLLKYIIDKTLPENEISIIEDISADGKRYIATLTEGDQTLQVFADTDTDWLPDDFFEQLEQLPLVFKTGKLYYSINPAIGLTGQDAWYFCGTEDDLKKARKSGIPLIYPGEDITETEEFKRLT